MREGMRSSRSDLRSSYRFWGLGTCFFLFFGFQRTTLQVFRFFHARSIKKFISWKQMSPYRNNISLFLPNRPFKLSSATSRVEGFKFCQILNPREMHLLSVLEGADLSILSRSMYLAIVCPPQDSKSTILVWKPNLLKSGILGLKFEKNASVGNSNEWHITFNSDELYHGIVDGLQRYAIYSSAVCGLQAHHIGVSCALRDLKPNLPNSGHSRQVNHSLMKRLWG